MKTLWKAIKHNHMLVHGIICSVIILLAITGCEPKTRSLLNKNRKVTRAELNIELDTLLSTAELRTRDLDRQEQLRDLIFQSALQVTQGGQLSIPGLLLALGNIVGIGAIIDNRRKDSIIKTQKGAIIANSNRQTT